MHLAARGVTFANSCTPNPICVPGRASITTGNYSHVCTGNKGNAGRIRDDQIKIAQHFADAGYQLDRHR
jgi:arylsulfatase A-like enzyme